MVVGASARRSDDSRLLKDGRRLASLTSGMSEIPSPSTYNEPTVMWKIRHRDGRRAQAVIDPMNGRPRALWFVNGRPLTVRFFEDWTSAIEWTDRLLAQQWTVGWCMSDDIAAGPLLEAGPDV
jgi:hypothetical protein